MTTPDIHITSQASNETHVVQPGSNLAQNEARTDALSDTHENRSRFSGHSDDWTETGEPEQNRSPPENDTEAEEPPRRKSSGIFSALTRRSHRDTTSAQGGFTANKCDSENTLVEHPRPRGFSAASLTSFTAMKEKISNATFRSADSKREDTAVHFTEDLHTRQVFLIKYADALQTFGAPSHRVESQLSGAAECLRTPAEFVNLSSVIIVSFPNDDIGSTQMYFVRAKGRISLTKLHQVHDVYRAVSHAKMSVNDGIAIIDNLKRSLPLYTLYFRCVFAFFQGSIICAVSFGGSIFDMWISGACAACLQYLGLNAANKSPIYANVYEISVAIIVAFVARGLSNIPGRIFCYSAVSSAGTVVILPGFTVLMSALELMSRNIFCGGVRIVYAIIYTLFLGFGLTLGSDLYLAFDSKARKVYFESSQAVNMTYAHGTFRFLNGSEPFTSVKGVVGEGVRSFEQTHQVKGCFRDPDWGWARQPFPWWTLFFLVPIYSTFSSLSNGQMIKSRELPVMVIFSCCSFAANKAASLVLPDRADLVSAAGALTIGLLGNLYSRLIRGTAYTSMVTGVLFLVPSGIAQAGGLTSNYHNSEERYASGFGLALRMVSVASGVTIGLLLSQMLVYFFGYRKANPFFAF